MSSKVLPMKLPHRSRKTHHTILHIIDSWYAFGASALPRRLTKYVTNYTGAIIWFRATSGTPHVYLTTLPNIALMFTRKLYQICRLTRFYWDDNSKCTTSLKPKRYTPTFCSCSNFNEIIETTTLKPVWNNRIKQDVQMHNVFNICLFV